MTEWECLEKERERERKNDKVEKNCKKQNTFNRQRQQQQRPHQQQVCLETKRENLRKIEIETKTRKDDDDQTEIEEVMGSQVDTTYKIWTGTKSVWKTYICLSKVVLILRHKYDQQTRKRGRKEANHTPT